MDCSSKKFYHKHNGFDSRGYAETFFSEKPDMEFGDDSLKFPMMNFHYVFSSGFVKGDVLIDLSFGSLIHHLYSSCDVFKDIIILKLNERCNMETSRWKNSYTGALEWKHASSHVAKLEGKSDQVHDKDEQLKTAISHIISCDFDNENITYPVVLPLADCISSLWILDSICKDQDDYMSHLGKMSKLLRPGGHLILLGVLKSSYIMIGGVKFNCFYYDESFVKNALNKLGFVIDYCAVQRRKNESKLTDYKDIMFITACKTK
ncbi:indolethylamine N-methyltransferase-like [Hyperolius riggenbachi]|uniref:indolethylamine N-methyltransferase-like n=1 Tax=Hyperolius riggenbachi TaxID=752182 RepID=UPI0035A2908D